MGGLFDFIRILINISLLWVGFFFLVKLLILIFPRLLEYINRYQIIISLFQISIRTTKLNGPIQRLSIKFQRLWQYWFNVGMVVSLLTLPISIGLFVYNLGILVVKPQNIEPIINPIVPGVNVQGQDSWYLFISLLISMFYHELGHALCIYSFNSRINDIGFFMTFIIPGAHVDIHRDVLYRLDLWDRLKVFCAGVWHNLALCIMALLLMNANFIILSPLYHFSSDKLYITHISDHSILQKSFNIGDQIVSINQCTPTNIQQYIECIESEIKNPKSYCLSESNIQCLNDQIINDSPHMRQCFDYNELLKYQQCTSSQNGTSSNGQCASGSRCIQFAKFNYHLFIINATEQNPSKYGTELIPFVGTAQELWDSFTLNNYKARLTWMSHWDIPRHLQSFYQYLIPISLGLAVFNVVSIYALDGEYILETLLYIFASKQGGKQSQFTPKITRIQKIILNTTLVLLLLNILISYYQLFAK
ncbi:membrane-bound transcription factor peptidase [Tieghemostelium lacteum]|uniref:Endopeptidase S2P n=1 Tax=Tieghemostelium lacteum TaxID=361077 RepID=A0A151ZSC3_TIELA|nr:membrane-bound transcription factor peptidase [Tieghemostelium lacteum]|eukprot:KYQ96842.1 membrane-bound transcription factor peptidase [Tieghemostelium lacteum]